MLHQAKEIFTEMEETKLDITNKKKLKYLPIEHSYRWLQQHYLIRFEKKSRLINGDS